MSTEHNLAYMMAMSAQTIAEVAGMMSENMQRQHRGESMAYTEKDFEAVYLRNGCYHNAVMGMHWEY
ncbi:MAG TPA: hypothetical protein VMQ76_13290 [Terracidiphilus sp.]|nr:hypothetical protein [Terracidiphilus sp.]